MRHVALLVLVGSALATSLGCEHGQICDPGQRYQRGLCYPAGPDAAMPGDDASPDDPFAHFGDACADVAGCAAPTDWCLILPGESTGYCTRTGCLEDASICPEAWSCIDLSMYQADLPSICVRP